MLQFILADTTQCATMNKDHLARLYQLSREERSSDEIGIERVVSDNYRETENELSFSVCQNEQFALSGTEKELFRDHRE